MRHVHDDGALGWCGAETRQGLTVIIHMSSLIYIGCICGLCVILVPTYMEMTLLSFLNL
jgi:hypothetical protein